MARPPDMFDSLVRNALDFFSQSITDFKKKPKYSVIHLATAIELFIKARLLEEHWTLIMDNPKRAALKDYMSGTAKTVGAEEAMRRLQDVLDLPLTEDQQRCFTTILRHRNKLVHFVADGASGDETTRQRIIAEQCRAWHFLHHLLTQHWSPWFDYFGGSVSKLDARMKSHRTFLEAKYRALGSRIQEARHSGSAIVTCPVCHYDAFERVSLLGDFLIGGRCFVCDSRERFIAVRCPRCGKTIEVYEGGEGRCECGVSVDIDFLDECIRERGSPKDEAIHRTRAFCFDCEQETVVATRGKWLCLCCQAVEDRVDVCEYCGALSTGPLFDSYDYGCAACGGLIGHEENKIKRKRKAKSHKGAE